jgi:hypothetical protein
LRRFEMKFKRFLEIGKSFFFGLALTGYVNFETLRDVPVSFTPNGCCEWPLHSYILSQYRRAAIRAGEAAAGSLLR